MQVNVLTLSDDNWPTYLCSLPAKDQSQRVKSLLEMLFMQHSQFASVLNKSWAKTHLVIRCFSFQQKYFLMQIEIERRKWQGVSIRFILSLGGKVGIKLKGNVCCFYASS